ncbi:protein ADM2a [Phyllopteryx taeniolatus]|uniref:protein ADM2a n=1 Tax=Phyllopteryx taeniolatus TaxID=161469 RepID=UPI002AD428E8|nr:protein ADM2a [Phyllopteryx taeniolatus]
MRSLLPLTVYCVSLVCFQSLLAEELFSLDYLNKLTDFEEDPSLVPGAQSDAASPSVKGRLRHLLPSKARRSNPRLAWAKPAERPGVNGRPPRTRRHAHPGSRGPHNYPHHAQLMRVGCVLGTCQVQNLSHRLYQLIGQSGREDSSPINPRSPHSYG